MTGGYIDVDRFGVEGLLRRGIAFRRIAFQIRRHTDVEMDMSAQLLRVVCCR